MDEQSVTGLEGFPKGVAKSIGVIEEHLVSAKDAAESLGISSMYFRRLIYDGHISTEKLVKATILGRMFFLRSSVAEMNDVRLAEQQVKAEQSAAKLADRQSVGASDGLPKTDTLIELRMRAKQQGVPYSNKNKADLIAALRAADGNILLEEGAQSAQSGGAGTEDISDLIPPPAQPLTLDDVIGE